MLGLVLSGESFVWEGLRGSPHLTTSPCATAELGAAGKGLAATPSLGLCPPGCHRSSEQGCEGANAPVPASAVDARVGLAATVQAGPLASAPLCHPQLQEPVVPRDWGAVPGVILLCWGGEDPRRGAQGGARGLRRAELGWPCPIPLFCPCLQCPASLESCVRTTLAAGHVFPFSPNNNDSRLRAAALVWGHQPAPRASPGPLTPVTALPSPVPGSAQPLGLARGPAAPIVALGLSPPPHRQRDLAAPRPLLPQPGPYLRELAGPLLGLLDPRGWGAAGPYSTNGTRL